jgi:hypothetical protein
MVHKDREIQREWRDRQTDRQKRSGQTADGMGQIQSKKEKEKQREWGEGERERKTDGERIRETETEKDEAKKSSHRDKKLQQELKRLKHLNIERIFYYFKRCSLARSRD